LLLGCICNDLLHAFQQVNRLKRTKESIKDPLFRFFEREITSGQALLSDVRSDILAMLAVCRGEQKQDNHLRALISALNKGQVPTAWMRYKTPKDITSAEWMRDFAERVKQLVRLSLSDNLRGEPIWLGGMFSPAAYITATRQLVAQSNGWSLEQLQMDIRIGGAEASDSFTVNGMDAIIEAL